MPSKGDSSPRTLGDLDESLPPIGEADDVVQMTVRVRSEVRKRLKHKKVDTDRNIEDLVDEALREYLGE